MHTPIGPVLLGLVLMLVLGKLGGWAAERVRQPAVLGELLAGVVLGNLALFGVGWLGFLAGNEGLRTLAELGVILLLFQVGLESDAGAMLSVGWSACSSPCLGVVAPFLLGWGVSAWLLPEAHTLVHVFIGATLCATSVGITARVLADLGKLQARGEPHHPRRGGDRRRARPRHPRRGDRQHRGRRPRRRARRGQRAVDRRQGGALPRSARSPPAAGCRSGSSASPRGCRSAACCWPAASRLLPPRLARRPRRAGADRRRLRRRADPRRGPLPRPRRPRASTTSRSCWRRSPASWCRSSSSTWASRVDLRSFGAAARARPRGAADRRRRARQAGLRRRRARSAGSTACRWRSA